MSSAKPRVYINDSSKQVTGFTLHPRRTLKVPDRWVCVQWKLKALKESGYTYVDPTYAGFVITACACDGNECYNPSDGTIYCVACGGPIEQWEDRAYGSGPSTITIQIAGRMRDVSIVSGFEV